MEAHNTTINFVNLQITNWLVGRSRILNNFFRIFFDASLMFEVIPATCYCTSIWSDTSYMLLYVHSSSTTFSNNIFFFFRDGSLALMTRGIHDEKLAQTIDVSLAHLNVITKEPIFIFLGSWGTPDPCTLETDRTVREIQSHSCRWLNFGPQIHWNLSLPVIGFDPLVHFEPFVLTV